MGALIRRLDRTCPPLSLGTIRLTRIILFAAPPYVMTWQMTLAIGFTSCFATLQDETKRRRSSVLHDLGGSAGVTSLVDSPFTHQPVWRTIDLRNFNSGSKQINAPPANDRPDAGGGAL